jgi:hypothetical protein
MRADASIAMMSSRTAVSLKNVYAYTQKRMLSWKLEETELDLGQCYTATRML